MTNTNHDQPEPVLGTGAAGAPQPSVLQPVSAAEPAETEEAPALKEQKGRAK